MTIQNPVVLEQSLIGRRFGRLVVIGEYIPNKHSQNSKRVYASILCKCDCGVERRYKVNNLYNGSTNSCGCFRREHSSKLGSRTGKINGFARRKYDPVEATARGLHAEYIRRHPGNLTYELFCELTQMPCYYCEAKPSQSCRKPNKLGKDVGILIYNGLDRIDISKGYDIDTVIPCCKMCNYMRLTQTQEEFYQRLYKIFTLHKEDILKAAGCN